MRISKTKLSCAMLNAGVDSSKALAGKAGVSVNTISRILNGGSATVPTVRKLAEALGCNPEELLQEG